MLLSYDQSECKAFCNMTGAAGFFWGEILNVFLGMLDESELDHLFKEEMDNIRHKVLSCRYILIYFIRLLTFFRFLAEHFRSLCPPH